jgi:hypothetical protein
MEYIDLYHQDRSIADEYYDLSFYLDRCSCHFVRIKTFEGKAKQGLALVSDDNFKHIKYVRFKSLDEGGDNELEYAYVDGVKSNIICSVIPYEKHPLKRLCQLYKETNFFYTHSIIDVVKIAHIYKGVTVPRNVFRHSLTLIKLGLANTVKGTNSYDSSGKMKLIDNPPDLDY